MEIRWTSSGNIPLYISTNPTHVNPSSLQHLYAACNYFPSSSSGTRTRTRTRTTVVVDPTKLRLALSHSSVVVSVFTATPNRPSSSSSRLLLGLGLARGLLVAPGRQEEERELVAFGRAVSDMGLTASIYDVMVMPSLRRKGIGKMVVRRIVRMLTSKDIYDIAALCSPDQRPFFQACGFGDDMLGSTTMMFTEGGSL